MLPAEVCAAIQRTDQRLRRRKAGEQTSKLRGNKQLLFLDGSNPALLFCGRTCLQKLFQRPFSVQTEAEIRMLRRQVHRFVDDSALDGHNFCLVVRISDIEMGVGNQIQCPFLLWDNRKGLLLGFSIHSP